MIYGANLKPDFSFVLVLMFLALCVGAAATSCAEEIEPDEAPLFVEVVR